MVVALIWLLFMIVGEFQSAYWFRWAIIALTLVLAVVPGSRGANRFGVRHREEEVEPA